MREHVPADIAMPCIGHTGWCCVLSVFVISSERLSSNKCFLVSFASRVSFVLELWRDVSSLWVPRDAKWHGSPLSVHDTARPWGLGRLGNVMAIRTHTHTQKYYLPAAAWTGSHKVLSLVWYLQSLRADLNCFPLVISSRCDFLCLGFYRVARHRVTRSDTLRNYQVRSRFDPCCPILCLLMVSYNSCMHSATQCLWSSQVWNSSK